MDTAILCFCVVLILILSRYADKAELEKREKTIGFYKKEKK